jgi:hypothetical protein
MGLEIKGTPQPIDVMAASIDDAMKSGDAKALGQESKKEKEKDGEASKNE